MFKINLPRQLRQGLPLGSPLVGAKSQLLNTKVTITIA
jgi:hypothetical protein